jgi:predicted PurR-regulated permease PerM
MPLPPGSTGSTPGQKAAIGALALGLLLLGLFTLWNFLDALAWAGVFAIALWPLYCRVRTRRGPGKHAVLLPGAFTLAVALLFIVPVVLVGLQLGREAHTAAEFARTAQQNGIPEPDMLRQLPLPHATLDDWWQQNLASPGSAGALVARATKGRVGDFSRAIAQHVAQGLTSFVFTLLTLFFLFKEGEAVTRQVRRAADRAFGPRGERVGRQIVASVHGTVNGLVLVGLGEGVLLGVVYAVAGVPHPTVFGALTAVAAMVPFAAPVVFGAAALVLAAQGAVIRALAVLATSMAVTFTADHFVRPVLIGGATRLPFLWVLLGILGGVEAWGLLGLFLGPAVMAALILLWREWTHEESL